MTRPWLIFVVLYSIFQIHFICYAELSIPTRDFALRVPQAKPTKPETYVSLYRLLLCVILKGALKFIDKKIKMCRYFFIILLFLGLYAIKT